MRWIKDSVHGDIFLYDIIERLVDQPELQRMRRISQTSFCSLLFPGANHTRFEHLLGTYHLTGRSTLFHKFEKEEAQLLALAGLLHDIGHTAFSHSLEDILKKYTGKNHEDWTEEKIRTGRVAETLKSGGFSPEDVIKTFRQPHGKLVTGELGTDRMDYLLRDSKYTGVAYGAVDVDRLLRMLQFHNGKLVLDDKGLSVAESLLLARFMMFASVYGHHVSKASEVLLQRAVEDAIGKGSLKAEDLVRHDDWSLFSVLRSAGGLASENAQKILDRDLPKRVAQRPIKSFDNWLFFGQIGEPQLRQYEREIAERAGIEPEKVALYIPRPWFGEVDITVMREGEQYSIGELSIISRILKEAQWDYAYVALFAPKEANIPADAIDVLGTVQV
jgi:HD superfamily phosphohydrolase